MWLWLARHEVKISGPRKDVALAGLPYGREEAIVVSSEEAVVIGVEEEAGGGGRRRRKKEKKKGEAPTVKSKDPNQTW